MNRAILIGPSHLQRMIREVDSGILPNYYNFKFWGKGGLPVFSKRINDLIKIHHDKGFSIYLMVPDFRFGNGIFNEDKSLKIPFYDDKYRTVDKSMINQSNDILLYKNALYILNKLVNDFPSIKFMFWDLFVREQENKAKNKYVDNGSIYTHPIWNYQDLKKHFYKNIIDISCLEDNFQSYIIDQQGHPSLKGQIFIFSAFHTNKPDLVFQSLENNYDKCIHDIFEYNFKNI